MFEQPRWQPLSLIPTAVGLTWLWCAGDFGAVGFLFAVAPGLLLLSAGVAALLWPGDTRIPQYAALGSVIGMFCVLPVSFVAGTGTALLLLFGAVAGFVAAGAISLRWEPHVEEVPIPAPSLRLASKVALDDATLALMGITVPFPVGATRQRICREVGELHERFSALGWLDKPQAYHQLPPPLEDPVCRTRRSRDLAFEHLVFSSEYEPWEGEPGRERWLSYTPNRTAYAWVLRHTEAERPWLVCFTGYRMGRPAYDFFALSARWLHHQLGLNLLIPVLPLHGPRRIHWISGDGFISGDTADTLHAVSQAVWDVRRLMSWLRAQSSAKVGVFGLSLGGYIASLSVSLETGFACAIAGIPLSDIAGIFWRHMPDPQIRCFEHLGVRCNEVAEVLRVVSPLALPPQLPRERRYVFGAVADRVVTAQQTRDLWRHWERPKHLWVQSSHVYARREPAVRDFIEAALRESDLAL